MTSPDKPTYQDFERAVLALATYICPQRPHCDRCRAIAAETLKEMGQRV